jgi:outer membrane immunogenic protein
MIRKQMLWALAGMIASISAPAFSQENVAERSNVAVQAFGSFVATTTDDGVRQNATNSGGVLATYRFFFDRHNGVEANYGYSLNTQNYNLAGAVTGVNSYSHEFTAAYVLRLPEKHWSPFLLAGTGALVFDPHDSPGASTQARAAFVYGGGADFNLTGRFFVRAEYRGFVYSSPTFGLTVLDGTGRTTHRAEPSIGFGFRL